MTTSTRHSSSRGERPGVISPLRDPSMRRIETSGFWYGSRKSPSSSCEFFDGQFQKQQLMIRLTKQYEGGTVKCGNYWQEQQYGPVRIKLESQSGGEDAKPSDVSGFDFGMATDSLNESTENIRRTFTISRDDKPDEAPRKIVQIQCTAWPDFDVPDSPQTLINLMRDVDQASCETCTTTRETDDRADHPPVLVHCEFAFHRCTSC